MLSGGELPALVIVDAVARLVPGVVGDEASVARDTFARGLLDYPQYTRPAEFRGMGVPPVLLSGHHSDIERWRRREGAGADPGTAARFAAKPPRSTRIDAAVLKELLDERGEDAGLPADT